MGMSCFMCGLGVREGVKLTHLDTFDDKNRPISETVCAHCKGLAISGNHPSNQNPSDQGTNVEGFIKPSNADDKPSVRPQ